MIILNNEIIRFKDHIKIILKDNEGNTVDRALVDLEDEELVKKTNSSLPLTHRLPLTEIAKEKTGKVICANIVALGAMTRLLNIDHDAMLNVLKEKLPQRILDINLVAYEEGYKALGDAE